MEDRKAIILALCILYALTGVPEFFSGNWFGKCLVYHFFHASIWHLLGNSLAIYSIYRPGKNNRSDLLWSFAIAVLVYPLALRPAIGFSNIIYATVGLRSPSLSSPWWRQPGVIVFLAVTVLMVFVPSVAATTHIAAFVLGAGIAAVRRAFNSVRSDVERYIR